MNSRSGSVALLALLLSIGCKVPAREAVPRLPILASVYELRRNPHALLGSPTVLAASVAGTPPAHLAAADALAAMPQWLPIRFASDGALSSAQRELPGLFRIPGSPARPTPSVVCIGARLRLGERSGYYLEVYDVMPWSPTDGCRLFASS
jgi:hypothetical protein